ncbi:amino acid ABC transporter ATP-binding/permease protein [Novosphingobium sp. RL4]|uniref:amino acid ABC transporter ATP-binding/permease protein n=1 Tax=Novosphingobium sp. RL4 TaxID=3109595 RepID=UPI002D7842E8|nr:ATP-binding cassette domain-containing protein [Novosphingobium sp. RL4]WRT93170.1 ATP-binding cassette domain-containing protein [Novosphingobium sp. RL4]
MSTSHSSIDRPGTGLLATAGLARRRLFLASFCAALAAISAIGLLAVSGWFLTAAALAGSAGVATAMAFNYLIPSAAIRLLAIVRTLSRYGERLLSHKVALEGMAELRGSLFEKLAAQDSRKTPDTAPGEASTRLIDDVEALEDLVIRQPARHAALVAAATSLALVAFTGLAATIFLAAMMAALPVLFARISRRLTHLPAEAAAAALGDLRERYVELAASRAEIAAYGLAGQAIAELAPLARRLDLARAKLFRAEALQGALLSIYGALGVAGVLLLAKASAPLVALAMLATTSSVEAMGGLSRSLLRRASLAAGLRRIAALNALDPALCPTAESVPVSLTLGGRTFEPGARIAITGPSGSGKTRVLLALAGMGMPTVSLRLDGQDIASCPPPQLRAAFALSPQDAPMLIGSVADNLRIARPGLGEAEMWEALETAQLKKRIARSECGLDTPVSEGGGILSGGERKRLSLARALLAGRPWLLLDEPSEGLDAATEQALVGSLRNWLDCTGTGLVLVSHRKAPLDLCDVHVAVETLA